MPLSGGTSGAHDDSMHQGNAKRDVVDGLAGLGPLGELLAPGSDLELTGNGSSNIYIRERISGAFAIRLHKYGVGGFTFDLYSVGVWNAVLTSLDKDVINGIAALDAAGSLLLPGSKMYFTRDGSDDVHIYERTSDEEAYAFHRVGADDYTFFVKESNVWKRMQTESMKDAANGIAGLDANVLLSPALLPPCMEEYSNHLGAVDNFTQTATGGNGTANTDVANHEMDLSTGINAVGYSLFETKTLFTPGNQVVVANFIIQNIVDGVVNNRRTYIGLLDDFTVIAPVNGVFFDQLTDGTWEVGTAEGGITLGFAISALANGDHCTIVVRDTKTYFYVNHVLVGSYNWNMSARTLKCGVSVHADNAGISTARSISVDMITMKIFV